MSELQEPDETRRENQQEFVDDPNVPQTPDPNAQPAQPGQPTDAPATTNAPQPANAGNVQSPQPATPGGMTAQDIDAAYRTTEARLSGGELTLDDVFEDEGAAGMQIGNVMVALPSIGEEHTDTVLGDANITRDRTIESLTSDERAELLDLAEAYDV